jgi:hypothetical protein
MKKLLLLALAATMAMPAHAAELPVPNSSDIPYLILTAPYRLAKAAVRYRIRYW